MSRIGQVVRCFAGALLLWTQSHVLAGPAYLYSGGYGDTARPTDINDVGTIVWTGFCDSHCGSRLEVGGPFVAGFAPWPNDYTRVTDINNNGDMLGTAIKGGVLVPTIWLGGVPYDLNDPANAGLVFDFDPGPKTLSGFDNHDLLALNVLNLPSQFLPTFCTACSLVPGFDHGYGHNFSVPFATVGGSALTNARGDIVFEFYYAGEMFSSFGILRAIPEPSSSVLVLVALMVAFGTKLLVSLRGAIGVCAAMVAIGICGQANAAVVRMEATFGTMREVQGVDLCPVGSACDVYFQEDTGVAPQAGTGTVRFNFDTSNGDVLPGGVLTMADSDSTRAFALTSVTGTNWGGGLFCPQGGIFLSFATADFYMRTALPFCGPEVSAVFDLAYVASTTAGAFPFRDVGNTGNFDSTMIGRWSLWAIPERFGVIAPVLEPASLLLVATGIFGLMVVGQRREVSRRVTGSSCRA